MKVDFDVRPALPNVTTIAGELVDEARPPAPLLPPAPASPIEVPFSAVFTGGVVGGALTVAALSFGKWLTRKKPRSRSRNEEPETCDCEDCQGDDDDDDL